MKIFLLLILASFVVGGLNARRDRPERFLLVLGGCVVVAVMLSMRRFV